MVRKSNLGDGGPVPTLRLTRALLAKCSQASDVIAGAGVFELPYSDQLKKSWHLTIEYIF